MLIFLLIDTAAQSIPKILRKIVFTFYCRPGHFLLVHCFPSVDPAKPKANTSPCHAGGIYITNTTSWITTVEQTTEFLNRILKPNELFFALPYDCLYYYLTDKKTPTRQLIFFDHIKIPTEQEVSVIAELEKTTSIMSWSPAGPLPVRNWDLGFWDNLLPIDWKIYPR